MLQKITVKEETFGLLKTLMLDENLKQFYLVGGTALARIKEMIKYPDKIFPQLIFN